MPARPPASTARGSSALKDAEDARFARRAPEERRPPRARPGGDAQRRADGLAGRAATTTCRCGSPRAKGARITDVDGHTYVDFNIADMSMFCGYAPGAARPRRERADGARQPVPPPDRGRDRRVRGARPAVRAAEVAVHELGDPREHGGDPRRPGRDRPREGPHVRRASTTATSTRRSSSSMPTGASCPRSGACPRTPSAGRCSCRSTTSPALERALERRDIALVLTEPAITNNIGLLLPDEGFHAALRRLTRETGTLLAYDETHTQVVGPGGLVRSGASSPTSSTTGKSIAGGLPFGAWGMTEEIAELLVQRKGPDGERANLVATGGTIFGNALVDGGGARGAARDPHARGVRAHAAPGGTARGRDARERRGARAAVAHPAPRAAVGLHVPADADPDRAPRASPRPTSC